MLIANPAASGFTQSLHGDVIRILERSYRVYAPWPDGPEQARGAAAQAAHIGYDMVVAMGGDGTAHVVANGLYGSATPLGIVPAGTTNVLSRIVGLGTKPRTAAEIIASNAGRARPLRVAKLEIDGPSGAEQRIATFAAGVGFDAEILRESERRPFSKVSFGAFHYARSAFRVAASFKDRLATLRVESGSDHADAVGAIVQVHDDLTYLGGRSIRLAAPPGPVGLSVERVTTWQGIRFAARASMRLHLDRLPGIRLWRGFETLAVSADPPALAEADGEVIGDVTSLRVTPQADGLLVVDVPSDEQR